MSNPGIKFRTRLFILVSALLILSMSIISSLLLSDIRRVMSDEFMEKGILLAREFSQKTAEGIVIEDKEILNRSISQLGRIKDILYVFIYNESGLLLSEKVLYDDLIPGPETENADSTKIKRINIGPENEHSVLNIPMPVYYDGKRVGHVRLGISLERINDEVNKRILNSVGFVLAFILIGLVICYFFSRSISSPISQLLEGVRKIGNGDLSYRVEVCSKGEVGELADEFNRMIERLSKSDEKLKKYALDLESKVKERTSELNEINSRLEKDISQRKSMELALRESKERYQMLFNNLPAGVIHYGEDGTVLNTNGSFADITGVSEDRIIGATIYEILENKKLSTLLSESLLGRAGAFEDSFISRYCNKKLFLKVAYHGIINEEGQFIGGVGLFEDNTERRRAEEEKAELQSRLQHAQKMELVGTLASGVAHDLNNILSGLVTYPELLLMELPEEHRLHKSISIIQKSGQKAAAIVQDLLTLARRGVTVTEVVNFESIISEFLSSNEFFDVKEYHQNVRFKVINNNKLNNIEGSSVHLFKCIMNLVSNAAEAIEGKGAVTLTASNEYLERPVNGYDSVVEGEYVVFSVIDDGIGMSPEEASKIFEPFYTKKAMGRSGTGLGMAVVWGAVKDHNGYIDVKSVEGDGTRFDLYFPATREGVSEYDDPVPLDQFKGSEKILLVDDVPEQRQIAELILEKLGYSVVTKPCGEDAVEYMKDNSADLVILDMIMDPGIDGLETYKRILEQHPGQKAVIASGFAETERVKKAQNLGVGTYIKKPYSLEKISRAIRTELDS